MKRIAFMLVAAIAATHPALVSAGVLPRPPGLVTAVGFWTTVYTRVTTNGGLLHDRDNLAVIYETLRFPASATPGERWRRIDRRREHYSRLLRRIADSDRDTLPSEARRVLALWPEGVSDARLLEAARDIRFQRGQADRFRAGLVRSGAWEPYIHRVLRRHGLPQALAVLPQVESSFNPEAYSHAGAAGIWQFTRATGRRFMRIDYLVDERMDPFRATVAAARLLKRNYAATGNWALAITAYNHGRAGIRNAVDEVGSKNIVDLIAEYESPMWGFASRNFYAAFLAAVHVDRRARRYFGPLDRRPALHTETVRLPFYASIDTLTTAFQVERERLHRLNRALRSPIWQGEKRVPRGYVLRVPADPGRPPAEKVLARIETENRYYAQIPSRFHRVRPGQALSTIARRYGVSTAELVALNDLRSRDYIRAGQRLRLPLPAGAGTFANGVYTVRRGDTVADIAQAVGMSIDALAAANGLDDPSMIYPGQQLHVDGSPAPGVAILAESESAGDG